MEVFLYRQNQFHKRLSQLYRAGGKECQVAGRVDRIIEQASKRGSVTERFGKMTKYREARVDKCRKLNLGSGYRLLYLVDRSRFLFLFVGTHDECDRWLKHNTGFEASEERGFSTACSDSQKALEFSGEEPPAVEESDYEERLVRGIDDKMLRRIFRGLSGEQT